MQAVTREAGHLKLAGRNYFVSTFIADMGHTDVTQETGVTSDHCAVIVSLRRNHFLGPHSSECWSVHCTLYIAPYSYQQQHYVISNNNSNSSEWAGAGRLSERKQGLRCCGVGV